MPSVPPPPSSGSPPSTTPVKDSALDGRPYAATGGALALALALNLWTGNGLWLAYTAIGAGFFLVVFALAQSGRVVPPARAIWMAGMAASFHYVGGSLSGLHQVGGPNGLYYAFPWWDNVVHALGSAAVAVAAAAVLTPHITGPRWLRGLLATCVAATVGVMAELYEFAQFVFFGTVDQGFYTNTMIDLYDNILGAATAAIIYIRLEGPAAVGRLAATEASA